MSKKKRSKAQIAATRKMLAANKAKRAGKRVARKAKRVARVAVKSSGKRRTSKRRARARVASKTLTRRIYVAPSRKGAKKRKLKIEIRRAKRSKRRASKPRGRVIRTIKVNPAFSMSGILAPITGVVDNLQKSFGSAAGIAGIAGGAIGSIAGGTLLARFVMPAAMKMAPGFAASPMGARVISVGLYYGAGFLLARFLPVNDKIKRGILGGAVAAALLEVLRPGTVQNMVSKVPGVGPLLAGNLGGIEPELGGYVEQALAGLGGDKDSAAALASESIGAYELGEYEMDGLGCSPAADELVQYSG